jgi:hypothetical protein
VSLWRPPTMPVGKAKRIDWSDEDALLNIDWAD